MYSNKEIFRRTCSFFILLFCFSCEEADFKEELVLQNKIALMQSKISELKKELVIAQQSNYWFHNDYEGDLLKEQGIEDPEDFIQHSLRERLDLIPIEAILGGSMIYGKIQVISDKWILAEFEDGHIYGRAIYSYQLNKENELDFELLIFTN
jgi:hypothetical protein